MKFFLCCIQLIFFSCFSSNRFADEKEKIIVISTNNQVQVQSIYSEQVEQSAKKFTFDWNNYTTIAPNQPLLNNIENLLQRIKKYSYLNDEQQFMLGNLFYRLGTYYTHITRQPNLAISKMDMANNLLKEKIDKAWNYDHLSYAYEQKYALSHQVKDKEKAIFYYSKVINLYPKDQNQALAFAYFIKGLIEHESKNYGLAEANFKKALTVYEQSKKQENNQYIRMKNSLAAVILAQNDRDQEALSMLQEINDIWRSKKDYKQNPYAARNFITLGKAYLKINKPFDARNQFDEAILIYKIIYGENSSMLARPYRLLAQAYAKIGDQKQAGNQIKKARRLSDTFKSNP